MNFSVEYKSMQETVNQALVSLMDAQRCYPPIIFEAMKYSLCAGGKRIRPILLLSSHKLMGGNIEESMPLACSMELIHTYSLIHDDLPAMDNDDYRRGMLTNHRVYNEGIAILAGDGLLNMAYETMIANALRYPDKYHKHLKAMSQIATAAGVHGMIGGQIVDLEWEGKQPEDDILKYIHEHKTGALIVASLTCGVALEDADEKVEEAMKEYGNAIGLAFQISDDILDVTGDLNSLGKNPGRDEAKHKITFPQKYGLDASKKMAEQLIEKAIAELDFFGQRAEFLRELARFIIARQG